MLIREYIVLKRLSDLLKSLAQKIKSELYCVVGVSRYNDHTLRFVCKRKNVQP